MRPLAAAHFVTLLLLAASATRALQDPAPQPPPAPGRFDPATLPEVVARVNGLEIHRDRLVSEARGAYQQLRQMGQAPVVDAAFFARALDQLIAGILIHEEAKAKGVGATDAEVEERLAEVRGRFPSEEELARGLERQGTSLALLRDEIAVDISRRKYAESEIAPAIEVSEEEVRRTYDDNLDALRQPERVKVRHILVALAPDAGEEVEQQARQRAARLLQRVREGEDLATLAAESSDDPTKSRGGELPWIARGQTLPAFEQAAFALERGEISDLVETGAGLHIIQGMDRQDARTPTFDETRDRLREMVLDRKAQAALLQRVAELMTKADVERQLEPE